MMNEEIKYPIYSFHARWNQDDYERNGTNTTLMFRTKLTALQEAEELEKWWKNVLDGQRIDKTKPTVRELHPHLLELRIAYERDDTWCLRWFAHMTFNVFENESDAFKSFSKFVQEKLPLHHNCDVPYEERTRLNLKTYCLMGAEDQWRWKLCGRDECKKEGITAIKH